MAKLETYRWETTRSPEYLNNAKDYNTGLHILANKWVTIKNIIQKQNKQEEINKEETQEINDFKSFIKRDNLETTLEIITTKEPPQTTKELRNIRYRDIKSIAKLILNYETYYETRKKNNATTTCKTCKKYSAVKPDSQFIENTANCIIDYWNDRNAKHKCDMKGCDEYFKNEKELAKHKTYHCGNGPNPYNSKNPEIIDRRTYHGAGIPKTDQYDDKIRYESQKMGMSKMRLPSRKTP